MRVLCVCNGAHVRSVTLARILRKRGLEVLTCGVNKGFSDDTIVMLMDWADVVYIQKDSLEKLKARTDEVQWACWEGKLDTRYDVGPDDWKVPQHPDLLHRLRELVEKSLSNIPAMERYGSVEEYLQATGKR